GSVVGATATLFSTPTSGKELRTRARIQGAERKNVLADLKNDGLRLKDQIKSTSKERTALLRNLTKEMKNSVNHGRKAVETQQINIYEYLENIESSLRDLEEKVKKG